MFICSRTGPSKILAASSNWIPCFVTLAAFFAASHSNPGGIVGHLFLLRASVRCFLRRMYVLYLHDRCRASNEARWQEEGNCASSVSSPSLAKRNGKRERRRRADIEK